MDRPTSPAISIERVDGEASTVPALHVEAPLLGEAVLRSPPTLSPSSLALRPSKYASGLASSLMNIELRTYPAQGLSDLPRMSCPVPISLLVDNRFRWHKSKKIRAHHLSWEKFSTLVADTFNVQFTPSHCELGWKSLSPIGRFPDEYFTISNEIQLQNAVSVMQESSRSITLYLWNPVPTEPVFSRIPLPTKAPVLHTSSELPLPIPSKAAPSFKAPSLAASPEDHESLGSPSSASRAPSASPKTPLPPTVPEDRESLEPPLPPAPKPSAPLETPLPTSATTSQGGNPTPLPVGSAGTRFDPASILEGQTDDVLDEPEQDEDEDEDDFQRRLNDYNDSLVNRDTARMQARLDSTACMQLSPEIWKQVCAFFGHEVTFTQPEYLVKILCFGRRLLPVQAHSVWHVLREFNGIAQATIIGHVMGIGKTTIPLAIHHVQKLINLIHAHIRAYPEKHLLPSKVIDLDVSCPSNDRMRKIYGFDCPCAPSSPTHFVAERHGVTVILSPLGLLDTWEREHEACASVRSKHISRTMMVRAHSSKAMSASDQQKLLGTEQLFEHGDDPAESEYLPRPENSDCIVISTSQSFIPKFLDFFRNRKSWTIHPEGKLATNKAGKQYMTKPNPVIKYTSWYQTSIVSMLFRDEFHLEKKEQSPAVMTIRQTQKRQSYYLIRLAIMSGTPLTTGPLDIAYYVQLMIRDGWKDDTVLRSWMNSDAVMLGKKWVKECTTKPNPDVATQIIEQFRPLVERLVLRCTTQSNFLGHPPVKVPPNSYLEIECTNTPEWTERLNTLKHVEDARLAKKEARRQAKYSANHGGNMSNYQPLKRNSDNSYYRARICASFPGLMDLRDADDNPLRLTESEWLTRCAEGDWEPGTSTDPYYHNLDMIVKSSSKLKEIGKMIAEWKGVIDAEGKLARQIWCSYFFVGAYVQYLWMVHILRIPAADIVWINKTMRPKEITAELDRFHVNVDADSSKQTRTARYIVATSSAFSVGLTLAEAISVGFLEPDFKLATMLQGYSRHSRQGNKNPQTFSWLYVAAGSDVERKIMDVNRLRGTINEAVNRKTSRVGLDGVNSVDVAMYDEVAISDDSNNSLYD